MSVLAVGLSGTAHANMKQTLSYQVYAGGINAVEGDMVVDTSAADSYKVKFSARTRGFLAKLAPWSGSFASNGWRLGSGNDTKFQPELHKSVSVWNGENETKEYKYKKDGSFDSFVVTEEGKVDDKDIEDELTQGTTDVLSVAMAVFDKVAKDGKCEGAEDVFDGKRRFQLIFRDQGEVELQKSKYNAYGGKARECTVEVKPVAGAWHKKPRGWLSIQEQGRDKGTMPTVWLASLNEGELAVPVKVRVKTDYGTLFMHLAGQG